jgi:hypothetical protein
MVFETLGVINDQGEEVLRQLFTFAAQHLGREFSSYCSRAWARVSCCLQRSVAQAIVNRIDGRPDEPAPASESLVVSDGNLHFASEAQEEGVGGEALIGNPLMSKPSIGSEPLMSESVGARPDVRGPPPQIPVFPPKLREPREETKVGGERETANNVTESLVGGRGDDLGRGGREGCGEGVSRETHIVNIKEAHRGRQLRRCQQNKFQSSRSSRICKNSEPGAH